MVDNARKEEKLLPQLLASILRRNSIQIWVELFLGEKLLKESPNPEQLLQVACPGKMGVLIEFGLSVLFRGRVVGNKLIYYCRRSLIT